MPAGSAVGAESAAGVSVAMGDGEGGLGVGGGRGTSGKRKRGSPVPSPVPSLRLPELRGPEASSTGSRAGGVHQPMTVSAVSFPRGPAFPRSTAPIGSGSSLILPPYPDSKSLIRRRPDRISQPQGRSDGTRGGPSGQGGSAAQERGQPSTTPGAFNPLSNLSHPPTPQQPPSVPSSPPVAIDIDVTESGGGHWL
ncbi:unnamed protein product [Vitrella brassicaformis CCMP3155]|uniref:Uncharacterized protein n=1 Tax=Vitrella brassicaformis (strain CCMP3155) TaxID=1169540 RepID=A0A0G4EF98_VITBC|nr:unnamed protein product [Vitrella brassicaformis CCMP3155]|eukprot:CEL94082.1 unnamed protein product [Vitrella brassicaformis CCMP3155]